MRREKQTASIHDHLDFTPPPATDYTQDISPFFNALLATLLAKKPDDRFPSAQALRAVLEAGERSPWWMGRETRAGGRLRPRASVRRETRVYGRDTELETLRTAWHEARAGRGSVMLIEGEAGVGKSRLVDALLEQADPTDAHLLYGAYLPGGALLGFCDAVLGRFGRAHLDRAVRPYFRRAPALHQPFVAMMRREPMPMGQMEVGNEALVTASSVLLRGLAAEKPTLWIFDDLHDAPEAALRHFEAMARIAPTGPILLIATARPGLPDQVPERLARTERFTRMMLQPLQPDAVEAILREAVGDELRAEQLATPIAVKSGGNPYFLFSILAALRTEGSLSGSGALERIVIPSEIRDLVGSRLRDLSRAERMVLDAAAVQGMRFDADLIASVLEQPVIGVLQDLAEMERQRGIVRASGRLYRFGHNLLQEVVYEEIPARLCGEYHMRLAEVRAAASAGEPAGDDAPFLAHHYLRGVEPERALPYLTAALDHAQSRYLHEIGLDLIDRALQLEDLPESERLELLFRRVRCLGLLERREAERAAITDVTQLAEKLGDPALRARAWIELAHWLQVAGREPEALEAVQRASELAELSGDRGLLARIVSRLGTALARLRRIDEAVVQHERAYGIAREIGDLEAESHAAHSLGSVLRMLNRYDEASAKYERVLEIGADEHSRHIRGSLGVLRTHQGRWEDAERELRRQIKLARRYGERRQESQGTGNLGLCLTMAGRLGDARKLLERYSLFCSELAYRRSVAVAAIAQAQLEFFSGNLVLAHEHADEGHRRALEAHAPQLVAAGLHLLGRVHLAEGRADDAVTGFSESAAAYRSIGDRDRTTEALIDQAEAESARGDDERAHFLLNEAIEIAEGLPTPPRLIVALASRANLIGAGEDADRARTLLESGADRMAAYDRIRAEWLLFQATGEAALRAAARADLDRLIDSARPADRDGMRERPPLYAAVSQCT